MKKKIFISMIALEIGGIETSLINLLNMLRDPSYQVDLFLFRHEGELLKRVPQHVNLLSEKQAYTTFGKSIGSALKRGYVQIGLARLIAKIYGKLKTKQTGKLENAYTLQYGHHFCQPFLPNIEESYDIAISFIWPHHVVKEKVKAKKKVAWIHTDYSKISIDEKKDQAVWSAFDQIAGVSDAVVQSFVHIYPQLTDRCITIENILDKSFIMQQATEDISDEMILEENMVNLCSVGRFSYPKNFDNIPFICKKLHELGCRVRWYIIGYGGEEQKIKESIRDSRMEAYVILLGKKENPYPYIRACDVYVQPSRYEGKAVTVREAQILEKPVVITNFPTASSQLRDGFDGMIVPIDNHACAEGIKALLENQSLQQQLIDNCQQTDYSNQAEVKKLTALFD